MFTRREILKILGAVIGAASFGRITMAEQHVLKKSSMNPETTVYRAVSGRPDENLSKVIDLMGGIESVVGADDIVVIKPNVQWWNQGVPNLSALNAFVELIMHRPGGFKGEVVIGENVHRGSAPWEHAGWASMFSRNSDLDNIHNFNDLCAHLKKKYIHRFSSCHWIDADAGAKRVYGPSDGTGYVYCDGTGGTSLISMDNGASGDAFREVIMTYPVFKTDTGKIVDFKNGIWEKGAYTRQPLKFVNFAALNHHSTYCGATSAVKNYLGISDLSGGADPHQNGKLTDRYYNFHSFPFDQWAPGPKPGMIGAEIGVFMNTIRKADLNITTAEWVGMASRIDPPVAHSRAVLASTDPVALDYHSTKYLLYPNSKISVHNPDDPKRPLNQYLVKCSEKGGGIFDENHVAIKSFDFGKGRLQDDSDLVVIGEKEWGRKPKMILKYMVLRFGMGLLG